MTIEQREGALRWAILWALAIGIAISTRSVGFPTGIERLQNRLILALHERIPPDPAVVTNLLQQAADPLSIALVAEIAAMQSQHDIAIAWYNRLPCDGRQWEHIATSGRGRRYERMGAAAAAEAELKRAVALYPGDLRSQELLGHLLHVEGRVWEAVPHFFQQLARGKCRGDELLGTSGVERFFRADDRLQQVILNSNPPEARALVGIARTAIFDEKIEEAEALLRSALQRDPLIGEAQGRLGRIILNRGDPEEFAAWVREVPLAAQHHPEVWYVKGLASRQRNDLIGAARCFLEALELSPNHLGATAQIAGCLSQLGRSADADAFRNRADQLSEFEALSSLIRDNASAELIRRLAESCGGLGRYWEAAGWYYVLENLELGDAKATARMQAWILLAQRSPTAMTDPAILPLESIRLDEFALPRWLGPAGEPSESAAQATAAAIDPEPQWWFEDDAAALGIQFEYFEGTTEQSRLEHIFNVMGGGLGAIDYDGDAWPDLYIAQANDWRNPDSLPGWEDRLYRNQIGLGFFDVTGHTGLGDLNFSHGVTVGDYDQDGFLDLYIGNKGPNRLYRNNGDGTFDDVTSVAGVAGHDWTTSSVIADFSGDGLPDLYVSNYTLLKETTLTECGTPDQRKACTPDLLPAADDRFYVNQGNGNFRDASAEARILAPNGKGLGVVAWDFENTGRLGVFVANDTTPNYLFLNDGPNDAGVPQFREEAVVRGVAYDIDGNVQASMGVAAGDINGDGRIDLCMTDFFGSALDLYSQRSDGYFDDITRRWGVREPSLQMLGFGCQFGDFDGDGWEDLLITNGHVDQISSRGTPDRMPPQLFHNRSGARFTEAPPERLGQFFQQRYLGRGVALWDWNRDGATDAAISHLHAPIAVLTNRTPQAGRSMAVRLVGRTGCREPTGAVVTLRCSSRNQVRLLTAGDGFLSTNERRLHFSTEPVCEPVELEVRWPGGRIQLFQACAGTEITLIEGAGSPIINRAFDCIVP